ncbi:MAG: hypothetical protein QJR04_09585 [Burkholderia multivorans]|nr:hypothetical protein [Burkholderia multivorans]
MSTLANMPNPGTPVVGPNGRLTPDWFAFFISLLSRTGGTGAPIDIVTLQQQVEAQGKQIADLFLLENSTVPGALIGALLLRVVALESMVQAVVPVPTKPAQVIPEPVPVPPRALTIIPEPVAVPRRDTDDLRKLIEATA